MSRAVGARLLVTLGLVLTGSVVAGVLGPSGLGGGESSARRPEPGTATSGPVRPTGEQVAATPRVDVASTARPPALPGGRSRVFGGHRFLVAYYGTAGSGALGVLGETGPDRMDARLTRAARPFASSGRAVQKVYELIVTVADGHPGKDGDYNHDISRRQVRRYIAAAHRHGALVVLDIQPGHADFLTVARRWSWALADPWVGLALDPEWRMARGGVPGRRIGTVGAGEVNRVSRWLALLSAERRLPEKLLVLHQFRRDMVVHPERVVGRDGLAMVQHVDGYGTPQQKKATYGAVARPRQFTMGFKLFYDEDVRRMSARAVQRLRPTVRFVSFQ